MPTVAVLEPAPVLAPLLARSLPPALAALTPPDRPAGLLVLSPAWPRVGPWLGASPWPRVGPWLGASPWSGGNPCPGAGFCQACRILLTPGGSPPPDADAASVVSYGPSPRDSLTFSSLRDGGMLLALQRELVTLTGRRVERQELALPVRREPLLTLAWAGALLLAGTEPEALAALAGRAF